MESEAPRENMVKVYPRSIDLENTAKLKKFEETTVVDNMQQLSDVIQARIACLKASSS
jgi:flavoprotein